MTNEQLVLRIHAGIDVAENMLQLWQQNRGYIATIANRFRGCEELEDLKQQGYIGLCHAVDAYNPEEGVLFMTYAAFWVRKSMKRYIEECGSVMRIPTHAQNNVHKYKKMCSDFELYYGRKPTDYEIRYFLGIKEEKLENIRKAVAMTQIGSLDVPVGDGEETSMYDLLPGQESPEEEIVERMQKEQLGEILWGMVDELPEQQVDVLRKRFHEGKTLKETGEAAGLSVEQTRQMQNKALRSLRLPRRTQTLQALMYGEIYNRALKGNGVDQFNRTWTSSTERAALKYY